MEAVLWLVFILSAVVLTVVILLQEPKGGGLAEAFGGMGAQTFGVKATGITKFTAYVAVVFILSAILLTCNKMGDMDYEGAAPVETQETGGGGDTTVESAPADGASGGGAPAGEDENN
jgi:preprotein translocase subunit SecG